MKKLNPELRVLLILGIFNVIALIVFIPISAVFNMWGLTIGWLIGGLVTFINALLLFKTGEVTQDNAQETGKGNGLVILFYFARFILYGASLVVCALLAYKVEATKVIWKYSLFTCASALLPSAFIILLCYHPNDDEKKPSNNIEKK